MAQRHDDALMIQQGACNGPAVAKALLNAYQEARTELRDTDAVNRDPAVQLILHQLCHLAMISTDDHPHDTGFKYDRAYQACIDRASDGKIIILREGGGSVTRSTEPSDPRWVLIAETGEYSMLGRREPTRDEIAAAEDAMAKVGHAGWIAIMSHSEHEAEPPTLVMVRPLREPRDGFAKTVQAFLARRAAAQQQNTLTT